MIGILLVAALVTGGIILAGTAPGSARSKPPFIQTTAETTAPEIITTAAETEDTGLTDLLTQAESLAAQYDYEGAIGLITSDSRYASTKGSCRGCHRRLHGSNEPAGTDQSAGSHPRVLPLSDRRYLQSLRRRQPEGGYNQMMTTKDEFIKMMQSMYERATFS